MKRNVKPAKPAVMEHLQGLSTNSQGAEKYVEGVDRQKKSMRFEKRQTEGVKDRVRMTVPCVTEVQREKWRHGDRGDETVILKAPLLKDDVKIINH